MSRVSRNHTWSEHISTQQLEQELGLDTIDFYVARRQLRWLGHVSRMDFGRLPRRMLSSWIDAPRPRGAPQMTYGRGIAKALEMFHIDAATWHELAADRAAWRETLRLGYPPGYRPSPPTPPLAQTRPRRAAAAAADRRIDAHLADGRGGVAPSLLPTDAVAAAATARAAAAPLSPSPPPPPPQLAAAPPLRRSERQAARGAP